MKQLLTLIIVCTTIQIGIAQEAYFSVGKNFTTYNYTNSLGVSNANVSPGSGNYYEVGYVLTLDKQFSIGSAVTLNEYNATGGNSLNNYSWDTNYLGFQEVFKYTAYEDNDYSIKLNAGLNLNHIINGQQKINGQTIDLTKEKEFRGIFMQGILGIEASYLVQRYIALGICYNYSRSTNLSNGSDQKVNFSNSQLQFNIIMPLQ